MGEIMRGIPFPELMNWAFTEYKQKGSVFGVRKSKFYKNESGTNIEMFGEKISSPVGPAAGPNSQLAQNIIASYLAGARFMELKTVQVIDGEDLRKAVPRPCINAEDEGYNVEWSTEFTVGEAFDEYIKAWFAIHVLAKEFGISDSRDFIFNISVGYDLEGIKSAKIDGFIEGMKNASQTPIWKECVKYISENSDDYKSFTKDDLDAVNPAVSPSITVSTLHGCPPDEIEKIATYLLTEKKIHTYVKCNPTLLGYEFARKILDDMGYNYISFTDHHFNNDLQFKDAIPMLKRLKDLGDKNGLDFGVKITNTFPVKIENHELPGEEMYMSGRSLYPLSINVAKLLSNEFDGKLPISYSGGADYFNIEEILATGIRPVTVATTLLKPGGYARFNQLAKTVESNLSGDFKGINLDKLNKLATDCVNRKRHLKDARTSSSIKTSSTLGLYDCFIAPCKDGGCPINQQIPEYMNLLGEGKVEEAFKVIAIDNPLPAVTGTICDHNCQNKCTRNNYDDPVTIRSGKLTASENAQVKFTRDIKLSDIKTDEKVVVIGAGPAGIAVSNFLRRNGIDVTVLEKQDKPFGIVRYVIPEFRISYDALERDYNMAVASGVNFKFGVDAAYSIDDLKKEYDYVVIATGAWKEGVSPVKEGGDKVIDALDFLKESKEKSCKMDLGKRVAVIGAGDVAMDCSRAAKRAPGVEDVVIVYRRTREFMPALHEEIDLALNDGVKLVELLAPVSFDGKTLTCEVQELTEERDASGRKKVKGTGKTETMQFDTVIGAVGARVDFEPFKNNGISLDKWNVPILSNSNETNISNVYIAGDCKAGASTVVKAIADAKVIAKSILAKSGLRHDFVRIQNPVPEAQIYSRKGVLADKSQKGRCLSCDQICEVCTDVCPNRANVSLTINTSELKLNHQILHIDGMCNECGNCGTFCPHTGNPYKDKLTLFWTKSDFDDSKNKGFLKTGDRSFTVRREDGEVVNYNVGEIGVISNEMAKMIDVVIRDYNYYLV